MRKAGVKFGRSVNGATQATIAGRGRPGLGAVAVGHDEAEEDGHARRLGRGGDRVAAGEPEHRGGDWAARTREASDPRHDRFNLARTEREEIEVQRARLAMLEGSKVLVHRDTVRAELARHLSTLRESLLQLPVRLQSVLAQEQDEAKVHDLLQDEVDLLLERISGVM